MVLPGRGMSWKDFVVALKTEWTKDNVGDVAGALTFFAVLAIFPFMLFLVALASVVIDPALAEQLVQQLGEVAPAQVTEILGGFLRRLGAQNNGGLLTVGALGAIWAASSGIASLMRALNTAYGVKESRPFWKVRLIALGMTLFAAVFAVVAAVVIVAIPPLAARVGGPAADIVSVLRLPVGALLMMFVWAVLYYVLPDVEQRFRFITPGSVFGVLIWLVASWGFSVYVANFGKYESTYGALGGVIVLLFWMWLSSQVVLLGAEINAILEHRSPEGKRVGAKSKDDTGADTTKSEKAEREHEALVAQAQRPVPAAPRPASPQLVQRAAPAPRRTPRWTLFVGVAAVVALLVRRRAA